MNRYNTVPKIPKQVPVKSVLSNGDLISKADEDPKVRRFLDAYLKLEESDRAEVDRLLTRIQNTLAGMGPLGAIELFLYVCDFQAACKRPRAANIQERKFLRRAHALEQAGWPGKHQAGHVASGARLWVE